MRSKACSVWWMAMVVSVVGTLIGVSRAQASMVAYYSFDDGDYTRTGDGMDPGAGGTPYNMTLYDLSGNGNDAINTSTQLSQLPMPPASAQVYGAAIGPGEPGKFGQSHKFWRDPSDFDLGSSNTTYTIAPGVVPSGNAERTIATWFRQRADITAGGSQDKLWGYGTNSSGQAMDLSLEGGGLRIRHFGGNITYGSGYQFYEENPDGTPNVGTDAGWHQVTVRVNAGATTFADVDVFLDGVQLAVSATGGGGTGVSLNTVEGTSATGYPTYGFGIGSSSERAGLSSQNGLDGWLDDFRVYDVALTDSQIRRLFVIPEPASALLMIVGLAGSLVIVSRRRS